MVEQADNNQKIVYAYNDRGQIISIATTPVSASAPPASTVSYTYDLNGNMTSRTIGSDTTTYTYDADNELTSMTTGDGKLTQFAYDADGNRTDTWWHTNAANTTFAAHTHNTYDTSNRITQSWTSEQSDSDKVENNSYSYSLNGKDTGLIQSITNNLASSNNVTTLGYDSQNRLISATNWNGQNYTYTYDIDGNRTTTVTGGKTTQSLTFNTANEISSSGYTYDAAGRRTKDPSGGTITYNSAGQAISQTTSSGTDTMTYAGAGQDELIQQNAGTNNDETYIYGRSDQSGAPTLESSSDVGGNTYITDNDAAGEPIDIRAVGTGIDLYYAYDGLGRLGAEISDSSGTVATFATGQWDPYGAGSLQPGGSAAAKKTASTFSSKAGMTASAASSSESPWTTQGIQSYADSQWYKTFIHLAMPIAGRWGLPQVWLILGVDGSQAASAAA
ncbi:RHS repeat protein [Rudaeicoccus suwonensis]|uniref:YD repeat-containing protein n=1 Tax=Rudaeicoccus suwonensis TaxID=657409 RepID=A0A561E6S8_9MICO|nr:RHS repeat protein [Rudaeicoccus suwonensis]TWE11335.1 YD repeat-containing protein [Rudaeicoccus suwonensis]